MRLATPSLSFTLMKTMRSDCTHLDFVVVNAVRWKTLTYVHVTEKTNRLRCEYLRSISGSPCGSRCASSASGASAEGRDEPLLTGDGGRAGRLKISMDFLAGVEPGPPPPIRHISSRGAPASPGTRNSAPRAEAERAARGRVRSAPPRASRAVPTGRASSRRIRSSPFQKTYSCT